MAEVVLGIGTSHSPMLSMPSNLWPLHAELDKRNRELVFPPDGQILSYEEGLQGADPSLAALATPKRWDEQFEACQHAITVLQQSLIDARPDVIVIISDDQDEILFEDNMPMFSVYWGDQIRLLPHKVPETAPPSIKASAWGYGDVEMDVSVDSGLGRHIIDYMVDHDFDIAHARYLREEFGGSIARRYPEAGRESEYVVLTQPRPFGLPHGFSFVVKRLMNNSSVPILPVFQNTCYPPNQPTPRRSYAFGQTLRKAIDAWDVDKRVVVVGSGGLSHFVLDEEIDRITLTALVEKDSETLRNLPRHRLGSAASEVLNWVAAGGALEDRNCEVIEYAPVCRTPAGTGGGWAFARWT